MMTTTTEHRILREPIPAAACTFSGDTKGSVAVKSLRSDLTVTDTAHIQLTVVQGRGGRVIASGDATVTLWACEGRLRVIARDNARVTVHGIAARLNLQTEGNGDAKITVASADLDDIAVCRGNIALPR